MSGGQARLKPSARGFFVASVPSLLAMAISPVAWSSPAAGPLMKMRTLDWTCCQLNVRKSVARIFKIEKEPHSIVGRAFQYPLSDGLDLGQADGAALWHEGS